MNNLRKWFTNWSDEKQCLAAVKQDGWALRCIQHQTPEMIDTAKRRVDFEIIYKPCDLCNITLVFDSN